MEITGGAEEGFVREWTPCSHMLGLIPPRVQTGLFSSELCLTCIDVVNDYIALGTNIGLVYWYDRKKGNIQRLRCEASTSPITYVKIANTVDYMVGAGNAVGQVTVFQIPKQHPDNIPDDFKPKVEPKVERYTIGDLHKAEITAVEWSKNGMKLFSGDKNGVIIMSEIDFYMHLCKSQELVNEGHEVVQLSWLGGALLASTLYRSVLCARAAAAAGAQVRQVGRKDRKALARLGGVWQHSYSVGGGAAPAAYCARAGWRLWRAGAAGDVHQTLLFKEAISNPLTIVELLNPAHSRHPVPADGALGPLSVFREHFLVSHSAHVLYILDPRSLTAVAVVDNLRRILSVSVNKDEIFILEGPRSVLRLAAAPEPAARQQEDAVNLMTKSLTTSIQQAVNTVRDLTHIDQTVPFLNSVLEQPISILTKNEVIDPVIKAEECFELPPIKHLPNDISDNVLESIINEFRDVTSETEELRRVKSEELEKKLKMYNSIMEKKYDGELIHSRRSRKREAGSGASSRGATPAGRGDEEAGRGAEVLGPECAEPDVAYTSPCVMNFSVYSNINQETDADLEKQIEEKEKILAKMLNLESLSINSTVIETKEQNVPTIDIDNLETVDEPEVVDLKPNKVKTSKNIDPAELVPKLVELPNNWNLGELELKLDVTNGYKSDIITSPEDHLEAEWELV